MSIYYKKSGRGKNIVLLHGWGFSSAVMQSLAEVLVQDYCVTLIDLPGSGYSAPIDESDGLTAMVKSIAAYIPEPAVLIGWSLGGLVALKLAELYQAKIAKIILVASTPCFVAQENWPAIKLNLLLEFKRQLQENPQQLLQRFTMLQVQGLPLARKYYHELIQYNPAEKVYNPAALLAGLTILIESDLRKLLNSLHCPIKFIFGAKDVLIPLALSEKIAQWLPTAEISVIADAGHMPFISHIQDVKSLIKDFII